MQTFTTTLDQLAMHGGDGPWADGSGPPFPFHFPLVWLVVIVGFVAVAILGRRRHRPDFPADRHLGRTLHRHRALGVHTVGPGPPSVTGRHLPARIDVWVCVRALGWTSTERPNGDI